MFKCIILTPFGGKHPEPEYEVSMQRMFAYFYSHPIEKDLKLGEQITQALNYKVIEGANIAQNRDILTQWAMKDIMMTHVLWLDSDMDFPHDLLHRLYIHNKPFVGVNYPSRNQDVNGRKFTAAIDDGRINVITNDNTTGLEEVDYIGFGAVLISRCVMESIQNINSRFTWFFCGYDDQTRQHVGEDWIFCARARSAGYKIYVDHDLSKEIGHVGKYIYTYKDMLPNAK